MGLEHSSSHPALKAQVGACDDCVCCQSASCTELTFSEWPNFTEVDV